MWTVLGDEWPNDYGHSYDSDGLQSLCELGGLSLGHLSAWTIRESRALKARTFSARDKRGPDEHRRAKVTIIAKLTMLTMSWRIWRQFRERHKMQINLSQSLSQH